MTIDQLIEERWVFTQNELDRLRNPSPDDPPLAADDEFIASVPCVECELCVIVQRNGVVTNRWSDGTVGVPKDIIDLVDGVETYYSEEDDQYADTWLTVQREGDQFQILTPMRTT